MLQLLRLLHPYRNTIIQHYQPIFVKALITDHCEASCQLLDYFALVTAARRDKLLTITLKNEREGDFIKQYIQQLNDLIMGYYSGNKCHTANHLSAIVF